MPMRGVKLARTVPLACCIRKIKVVSATLRGCNLDIPICENGSISRHLTKIFRKGRPSNGHSEMSSILSQADFELRRVRKKAVM